MPERSHSREGQEHPHGHDHECNHEHGPHGPERCGIRGPGRPHGPEGHRLSRPPFGGGSVTEAVFYASLDTESKILVLLRELGRIGHLSPDGKGGQGRILNILSKARTMNQGELTEKLGIQPGSASEILSKLESAGLIIRSRSESDRRSMDIKLTEAGAEKEAKHDSRAYERNLLSALDASERETLLALLEKLSTSIAKHREDSGENDK